MRTAVVTIVAAVAVGISAVPAAATSLPPPNDTALRAAISGLPDRETTGALVRITGSAGAWSGVSGVSDVRTGAPVQRYLPGVLPADYPPVPVSTLLDHTSGLPSVDIPGLHDPKWILEHRFDHWSPRQVLDTAVRHPIDFQPGTAQKYTNTSYVVAGMLVEQVTGRPYARNLRDRITGPLGLCDTYFPENDPKLPNAAARGYLDVDGELVDVTEMNQSIPGAAGAIVSTAKDLDGFITGLFRGRLLGREMTTRLFTVPNVSMSDGSGPAVYSQGLMKVSMNGLEVWGKTGSRYGYSSGIFATRGLERKLAYSVNPTVKSPDGQPLIVRRIAAAAAS